MPNFPNITVLTPIQSCSRITLRISPHSLAFDSVRPKNVFKNAFQSNSPHCNKPTKEEIDLFFACKKLNLVERIFASIIASALLRFLRRQNLQKF